MRHFEKGLIHSWTSEQSLLYCSVHMVYMNYFKLYGNFLDGCKIRPAQQHSRFGGLSKNLVINAYIISDSSQENFTI